MRISSIFCLCVTGEIGFQLGQGFGHVGAAIAEANMARLVVDGAGEKKNAGLLNNGFAELEDILLGLEFHEADGTGVRRSP